MRREMSVTPVNAQRDYTPGRASLVLAALSTGCTGLMTRLIVPVAIVVGLT